MTSAALYLSRARVRRNVPAAALRELLLPSDYGRRAGAGHRLVWTLFADAPDRERDFLWREADAGTFYLLSQRPPEDRHRLFDLDEPKPFAPALTVGDRVAFALRANATVAKKTAAGGRGKPCDIVMAAIRDLPRGERAGPRTEAIEREGHKWLVAQGSRSGFSLADRDPSDGADPSRVLRVIGYRTLRVDHAGPTARLGILDFEGELEIRDPVLFTEALAHGFGRAKAFGCGLMLIRRASGRGRGS